MTSHRQQRVSELLHEELNLLIGELIDPRLQDALVNVTAVNVSPDLRSARVYVEHSLPDDQSRQVVAALTHAEGFLREKLLEDVNLRFVPHLFFYVDTSAARADRLEKLLSMIEQEQPAPREEKHADDNAQ